MKATFKGYIGGQGRDAMGVISHRGIDVDRGAGPALAPTIQLLYEFVDDILSNTTQSN